MLKYGIILILTISSTLAQDLSVEVAGLRIATKGYDTGDFMSSLRPFNGFDGTSVALMVTSPKGNIIALDKKASKITSFKDNTGTKLKIGGFNTFQFADASKDGKALMLTVKSEDRPSKKAQQLKLEGTLKIATGSTKKLVQSKPVAFKKGGKISIGGINFSIEKTDKEGFGDHPWQFELKTTDSLGDVASYHFYDRQGKELKSNRQGSSSFGFGKNVTSSITFGLEKKVSEIVVGLELWQDRKITDLPLNLTFGAGL